MVNEQKKHPRPHQNILKIRDWGQVFEIPRDTMRHNWSGAFLDATTATDPQSNWANFDMFFLLTSKNDGKK
jgi:hypothetical protein